MVQRSLQQPRLPSPCDGWQVEVTLIYAERMNKAVKKHRTTNRNRQQHEVTKAYMEIDSIQRMLRSQMQPPRVPYLECIREIIEEIEDETKEEDEERDINLALDEEKRNDDDEVDVPDIGRQTIIDMFRSGVNRN